MAIIDTNGNILKKTGYLPFQNEKVWHAGDQLFKLAQDLIKTSSIDPCKLAGVGLSMPGLISLQERNYSMAGERTQSLQRICREISQNQYMFRIMHKVFVSVNFIGWPEIKKLFW